MASTKAPMRLPPLRVIRVRDSSKAELNPCIIAMSSVLACWASVGYNTSGCAAVEQSLRACMDGPPKTQKAPSNLNFHLARMSKRMSGPRKHKGSKD